MNAKGEKNAQNTLSDTREGIIWKQRLATTVATGCAQVSNPILRYGVLGH